MEEPVVQFAVMPREVVIIFGVMSSATIWRANVSNVQYVFGRIKIYIS
jgi:hypothetical protein